jgi:hypothetical protein
MIKHMKCTDAPPTTPTMLLAVVCNVQVRLIQAARLKIWVKIGKNLSCCITGCPVLFKIRFNKNEFWAETHSNEAWHCAAHAKAPGHVVCGTVRQCGVGGDALSHLVQQLHSCITYCCATSIAESFLIHLIMPMPPTANGLSLSEGLSSSSTAGAIYSVCK